MKYEVFVIDHEVFEDPKAEEIWLNQFGEQGYMLTAVMPYAPTDGCKARYYFARQKRRSEMDITYDWSEVYVYGITRKPVGMSVPNVRLDTIPTGGSSHVTQGFRNIRTVLDAQGKAVGWGMACLHDGVCENLCKFRDEDMFQFSCPEHGGDETLNRPTKVP